MPVPDGKIKQFPANPELLHNFYKKFIKPAKEKIPPCFQERDPPVKFIMPRVVTPQIF